MAFYIPRQKMQTVRTPLLTRNSHECNCPQCMVSGQPPKLLHNRTQSHTPSPMIQQDPAIVCHGQSLNYNYGAIPRTLKPQHHPPALLDNLYTRDCGTIAIKLNYGIVINIALNQSVHLSCEKLEVSMSVSPDGSILSLIHPMGRVFHQKNTQVQVLCHDLNGNHKHGKITERGVCFTSEKCPLLYVVDNAGVRTSSERFLQIDNFDITQEYLKNLTRIPKDMQKLAEAKRLARFLQSNQAEVWVILGVCIVQQADGNTSVTVQGSNMNLNFNPTGIKVSLHAASINCSASFKDRPHLFVRKDDDRIHYDHKSFQCRCKNHSAGFNERGAITVF